MVRRLNETQSTRQMTDDSERRKTPWKKQTTLAYHSLETQLLVVIAVPCRYLCGKASFSV